MFPDKAFTIDGRLVEDIGEVIATLEYDIELYEVQRAIHDGETSEGKKVQIKATFKNSLTFKTLPEYYLGFKLYVRQTLFEWVQQPDAAAFDISGVAGYEGHVSYFRCGRH